MPQPTRPEHGGREADDSGGFMSRFFARFKKSETGDVNQAANAAALARKPVVRFADLESGLKSGVAQQLKQVKDADAAVAGQKAAEEKERLKRDKGEVVHVETQIHPADIDRWMPDHWLRSQYLEDVMTGPDSEFSVRNRMLKQYVDEEKTVSKNASTSFKFGFSKAVRMKMEQDALAAQRLADLEKMKEMMRNRLDTATVFDVKHDFFCRGLPSNQSDYLNRVKLLASNWCQRLSIKPPGSSPSVFAGITVVGQRRSRMDWGAMYCPQGADPTTRDSLASVYMGSLENNLPHTFGEIHFENGDIYQGEFKSGRLTGCGKYWYRSIDEVTCGDYYEGFFVNSRKSGIGAYTFSTAKAKYIGEFVNNKFCGFGIYTSRSENYHGFFMDDEKHGRGVSIFHPINGCIKESLYVGEFQSGRRHGLGRLNFVNCSSYFGQFCSGHMHGLGTLACFDGCKVHGTWHLGRRHGHFLIQTPASKDCQVILYDADTPVWSRCMVSSDMLQLITPCVSIRVQVEQMCTEIETFSEEKLSYYNARLKTTCEHVNGTVLDTVKACVEQARFHACQHMMFNLSFAINGDDIKVIRVDGERRNVYLRDFELFDQGVDDDAGAKAANDVTTTQKIARIVQRFQKSTAQGPEPEKVKRQSKLEQQAEASAKVAEAASNDLEAAVFEYSEMLKKPQLQMMDKLVVLLTVLKKLPAQAKLTCEHVFKLASMQSNDTDTLNIIKHFMTASASVSNVDWAGRPYIPSELQFKTIKKQRKELVALPPASFAKLLRILQNISPDEALQKEARETGERAREWSYYCDLAASNELPRFRTFVDVKNHFAKAGIIVFPPVGLITQDKVQFDDALIKRYKLETSLRGSDVKIERKALQTSAAADGTSSDSDNSVDFELQARRFNPLSYEDTMLSPHPSVPLAPAISRPQTVVFSDEDSAASDNDASGASAANFPAKTAAASWHRAPATYRSLSRQPELSLAFSPMKVGSATQMNARSRDKLRGGSGSGSEESD